MAKHLISAQTKHKAEDLGIGDYYQPIELVEFIAKLQFIHDDLSNEGWQDLHIFVGVEVDDYNHGELKVNIGGKRLETDKEEEKRMKAEERDTAVKKARADARANNLKKQEDVERAELARLKAKYEA